MGRRRRHVVACGSARHRRRPRRPSTARAVISAVGQLNRPTPPRHRRPRRLRRAGVPLRPLGPLRRPRRQAGGADRRRRQRVPDRARHRRRGRRTSPSSSARRSGCSRTRTTTSRSGPGVQWALRHLPFYGRWYRFLLFWPACDGGLDAARVDPDYPRPGAGGQRDERHHPPDVHRLDRRARWRRRPRAAGQGRARLPGHRQAHAAGQRQLAADAHPRRRRPGPRGHRPHRGRRRGHRRRACATRSTSSSSPPGSRPTASCGRWRCVGRDGAVLAERWGERPAGLPRHHRPRASRTCSACTGRARTWLTAAA